MKANNAAMAQRLRELRLARGIQQSEVARRLDISPAYLSLIEKGKRVIQLPLLFKALELYGVSMESFMESLGERHVDDGLARLLDEPLLRSLNLSEEDLASFSAEPKMVMTVAGLFNLYKNARAQLDNVVEAVRKQTQSEASLRFDYTPFDEVTDFLERNDNYFASLEERAEKLRRDAGLETGMRASDLERVLTENLGVRLHHLDPDERGIIVQWSEDRDELAIANHTLEQRLKFHLAHAIGLRIFDEEKTHKEILADYGGHYGETRRLIKIHLANYFAGALMLPYREFYEAVRGSRYDVEGLARRFEVSYETVAHRMCNLSAPNLKGLPMHFIRVDLAGNISKRYSGDGIRFSHYDGSCPKMAVHLAFLTPNVITKQYSRFPDGSTYFCFAKVVSAPVSGSLVKGTVHSIGLGTHADAAKHLVYADDLPFADPARMAVPVGTTCRFCERTNCNMRSQPSYKFAFRVDEYQRKDNFFSPQIEGESPQKRPVPLRRKKGADES